MKSQMHILHQKALKVVFPDSGLVMTSRDMVDVLKSLFTIIIYGQGASYKYVDAKQLARVIFEELERAK